MMTQEEVVERFYDVGEHFHKVLPKELDELLKSSDFTHQAIKAFIEGLTNKTDQQYKFHTIQSTPTDTFVVEHKVLDRAVNAMGKKQADNLLRAQRLNLFKDIFSDLLDKYAIIDSEKILASRTTTYSITMPALVPRKAQTILSTWPDKEVYNYQHSIYNKFIGTSD